MKKFFLLFILIVLFFSIAAVSASDLNQSENFNYSATFADDSNSNVYILSEDDYEEDSNLIDEIYKNINITNSSYPSINTYGNLSGMVLEDLYYKYYNESFGGSSYSNEFFNLRNYYEILDRNYGFQTGYIDSNYDNVKKPTFDEWLNNRDDSCYSKQNSFVLFYKWDNLERYYGDSNKFNVRCLLDTEIIFYINGVKYNRSFVNNTASFAINLNSGSYDFYMFSPKLGEGVKRTIKILPTVQSDNLVKYFKNQSQFEVKLLDSEGKCLNSSHKVTFNINGVFYTRQVNDDGRARLNINLAPGNYVITTTNNVTCEKITNNITVLSYIDSNDLVKYYKNDSQFIIRVLNKTSGSITFNINGVFYTRQINQTGHVKLNINLSPGEYIITTIFGECRNSNNITVLSKLVAKNLEMYQRDGSEFLVKLLDDEGNRLAGESVKFNINGVFYNRTTDSNGIARLNINLDSGDYIITSMYGDLAISNNIKISPDSWYYNLKVSPQIKKSVFDSLNDTEIYISSFDKISDSNYYVTLCNLDGYQIGHLLVDETGNILNQTPK